MPFLERTPSVIHVGDSLNKPAGVLAGTTWRQPQAVRPEVVMPWFKLQ